MAYEEIDVHEFVRRRANDATLVLLDVREASELARAALPGAQHIPMREIPTRLHELDKCASYAVLCHHGNRSERIAQFLVANGFEAVANIDGGINAYALQIDPSIPRY